MIELGSKTVLNGTYELLELLGQGGMGEVWRAQHLRIPKQVAVKVLAAAAQKNSEAVARFRREAEIASRLGHPNIVEIHDFNVLEDGRLYIVMELLGGEDLRQALSRGLLPREEALRLLGQVASALSVAHRAGVIHRDLKPENIFLARPPALPDEPPTAKILDFGISKMQGTQTQITGTHAVIGTPAYMSPEQASGKNDLIDARTDQFSLAAIAYEMFSGRCPFVGATLTEVIYKVVFEDAPSLTEVRPDLPQPLISAIERAMSKQPQVRFSDVSSFMRALCGAQENASPAGSEATWGSSATVLGPVPIGVAQAATQSGAEPADDVALVATQLGLGEGAAQAPAAQLRDGTAGAQGDAATLLGQGPPGTQREASSLGSPAQMQPTPIQQGVTSAGAVTAGPGPTNLWSGRTRQLILLLVLILGLGIAKLLLQGGPQQHQAALSSPDAGQLAAIPPPPSPDASLQPKRDQAVQSKAAPDSRLKAPRRPLPGHSAEKPSRSPRMHKDGSLPQEARERLQLARQALMRGDFDTALLKAKQSLLISENQEAWVLQAQAYCGKRDLGMARAMLRRTPPRRRLVVRRYCRKVGFGLPR